METKIYSFDLTGKVAIVTGSTRGIGKAIAESLAANGASVVVSGRRQEASDAVAAEIVAAGGKAVGIAADVNDPAARKALINGTVAAFGKLDIIVNNAGVVGKAAKMIDTSEETFDHMIESDFKSLYFMCQEAALQMKAQGCEKGTHPYRIINLASVAGIMAPIGDSVYGSLKAAVGHYTKIIAKELARYGILCNAIAPGYVVTDGTKDLIADEKNAAFVKAMIQQRRFAEPADIAGAATFLASEAAGYIDGVVLKVDGGMTL